MRSLAVWKALSLVFGTALWGFGCGSEADDPTDQSPDGTVTWCEVDAVLASKCRTCHVGEGLNGAPFALETFDDTQVYDDAVDQPRWEMMQRMVELDLMPPSDRVIDPAPPPLNDEERGVLLTWFDEGAKAVGGVDCR